MSTAPQLNSTQTSSYLFNTISRDEALKLAAQIVGHVLLPGDDGYNYLDNSIED